MTAVLTITIAVVGVTIAYFQWRTAHQKVALEVLEKRFTIYNELRDVVSIFVRTAQFPREAQIRFVEAQSKARFYFGFEVDEYLENLFRDLDRGDFFNRYGDRFREGEDQHLARMSRITAFYKEVDRMFVPYMRLDQKMPLWWLSSTLNLARSRLSKLKFW